MKVLVSLSWIDAIPEYDKMLDRVRKAGHTVTIHRSAKKLSEDEVAALLPGVHGCISGSDEFSRKALAAANALVAISRVGAGYDSVDIDACTEKGVIVATGAGSGAQAVAEFAFGLIFACARRFVALDRSMRKGDWNRTDGGYSPIGKCLGIVGLGHIGRELGRLASAIGMEVVYWDILGDEARRGMPIQYVELNDLLRTSDFVSLHVPLSESTRKLIGAPELALMKPTAYLINTSRGEVVDETALIRTLQERGIAGAGLDVFEAEPMKAGSRLRELDNVVLSPHIAGLSAEARSALFNAAIDNVLEILAGGSPRTTINPEARRIAPL